MKKNKKDSQKRDNSLSAATVNNIPLSGESLANAKRVDEATAVQAHLDLEAKAAQFAAEFKRLKSDADTLYKKVTVFVGKTKDFVTANRSFLEDEIFYTLAHNKNKKNPIAVNGYYTVAEWSLGMLGTSDDYVRQVFRESDKTAFAFENGMKLLNPAVETDEDGVEDTPPEKEAVPYPRFADKLVSTVTSRIADSSYSPADKNKIVAAILTQLLSYAKKLRQESQQTAAANNPAAVMPPPQIAVEDITVKTAVPA